ncbi:MAG: hypothetical protein EXS25_04405 [Pedosphaera sp.]|nr:hypothetical protein [Pedosphaera sp.]
MAPSSINRLPAWFFIVALALGLLRLPFNLCDKLFFGWQSQCFAVLLLATALRTLGGNLPTQNQVALTLLTIGAVWAGLTLSVKLILSGFLSNSSEIASVFLHTAAILLARGTAKRMLLPLRSSPRFGLWLIGIASALSPLWIHALRPTPSGIFAIPPLLFAPMTALTLVAITPWVLSKRPVPEVVDRNPILLWSLSLCLSAPTVGIHPSSLAEILAAVALAALPWIAELILGRCVSARSYRPSIRSND